VIVNLAIGDCPRATGVWPIAIRIYGHDHRVDQHITRRNLIPGYAETRFEQRLSGVLSAERIANQALPQLDAAIERTNSAQLASGDGGKRRKLATLFETKSEPARLACPDQGSSGNYGTLCERERMLVMSARDDVAGNLQTRLERRCHNDQDQHMLAGIALLSSTGGFR